MPMDSLPVEKCNQIQKKTPKIRFIEKPEFSWKIILKIIYTPDSWFRPNSDNPVGSKTL